jgi:hypothetical protein
MDALAVQLSRTTPALMLKCLGLERREKLKVKQH